MLRIRGKTIGINRGDVVSISISFEDNPPEDGTEVRFCVKDMDREVIAKTLTVTDGAMTLDLNSGDTNIPKGIYTWGLFVFMTDTDGYAPLASAGFEVEESTAYPGAVVV